MKKFVSIFKTNAFRIALLIGLFLTSTLIILAMLLGNESGNFVFQVQDGEVDKSVSITEDLDGELQNRLVAEGQKSWLDTTLSAESFLGGSGGGNASEAYNTQYNNLLKLTSQTGRQVINDNSVYIYSFYIVNTGSSVLELEINMSMSNITKGLDKAIRILTFNETDTQINIYQRADEQAENKNYFIAEAKSFASDNRVYSEDAFVRAGENGSKNYIKYSILFWLEGSDPDCVNEGPKSVAGGTIKFHVDIKVKS